MGTDGYSPCDLLFFGASWRKVILLVTSGYRPVFQRPDEALRQPNQSKDCKGSYSAETPISMVFSIFFGGGYYRIVTVIVKKYKKKITYK